MRIQDQESGACGRCGEATTTRPGDGVTVHAATGQPESVKNDFHHARTATRPYAAPGMPDGALERAQGIAETMPTVGRWPGAEGGDVR